MESLNKSQFILLVLLVSFVTSLVTGIVTATLVNQAPPVMTQTVNKVIEKTIETITSDAGDETVNNNEEPNIVVVTQEDLVVKLVEEVSSAVVNVIATKDLPIVQQFFVNPFGDDEFFKEFFPEELIPQFQVPQYEQNGTERTDVSSGTGFFVSKDGLLVTNKHVVVDEDAEYSVITNDGKRLTATVLGRDPFQDIAVLKVDGDNFNFIPLSDSDTIKVGQTVVAIGNTLGEFQNTVSIGIISGINRTITASDNGGHAEQLQKVIQTDAAINLGNSGGPLLDLNGKVVGVNTAISQGAQNVGFALPINIAKRGISDVQEFGKIRYAFLGIRYLQIDENLQKEMDLPVDYGIVLSAGENGEPALKEGGPAEKAGIKEKDIILEIDGIRINSENSLNEIIATKRVGQVVVLKVMREGSIISVSVVLDERPENL